MNNVPLQDCRPSLRISRRQFLASGLLAAAAARSVAATLSEPRTSLRPGGIFIRESVIPGETRADDVFPAHPNGIRLARDRYLVLFATRGWRGTDDDLSVIYQVRANAYDGPVLKEGRLAAATDDWDALGDGQSYKMSHGHPTAFGVPKGALIDGRPAAHANLFVAKWYKYARKFFAPGKVQSGVETEDLSHRTIHVEWVQFRLNDAEDDIEIVAPATRLQQTRSELGRPVPRFRTNQGYIAPLPFNDSSTEWIDLHSVFYDDPPPAVAAEFKTKAPLVAVKFGYSAARHRYEWIETSPPLFKPEHEAFEASPVRLPGGDWGVCARSIRRPAIWLRTADPFSAAPGRVDAGESGNRPAVISPLAAYRCADGGIRIFSGDNQASPYKRPRDPLYCWDVDPDRGFAQSNRRILFDGRATLPQVRPEAYVMADMTKVLAHAGGNSQFLLHRVRTWSINYDVPGKGPALLPHEKLVQGIYCARLEYDQAYPDAWTFPA